MATRLVELPLDYGVLLREPIRTQNIANDALTRLLVGKASDSEMGNLEAKAYFNFSQPIELQLPTTAATLVSLELQLKFDYYSYGAVEDSTDLKLNVFELVESLSPSQEYLNTTTVASNPMVIGEKIIAPGPFELNQGWIRNRDLNIENDVSFTITISLMGTLGQRLLDDLINDPGLFDNFLLLSEKYPGLVVTMPVGDKVLGFTPLYSLPTPNSTDSKIILKYAEGGSTVSVDFPIYYSTTNGSVNEVVSFSTITTDRTGTPMDGIFPFKDFVPADNKMYVQCGAGLMAKFELQKVYDYFDTLDDVVINSAEMVFENSYSSRPPQKLEILLLDSLNGFRGYRIDTLLNGSQVQVNDPYILKIQSGIQPITIDEFETRVAVLNQISEDKITVNYQTGKVGPTIFTEFFQQIITHRTAKRRAKAFAIHPVDSEFGKTVSTLKLDPSSAKLKIYYSKPLTSLP